MTKIICVLCLLTSTTAIAQTWTCADWTIVEPTLSCVELAEPCTQDAACQRDHITTANPVIGGLIYYIETKHQTDLDCVCDCDYGGQEYDVPLPQRHRVMASDGQTSFPLLELNDRCAPELGFFFGHKDIALSYDAAQQQLIVWGTRTKAQCFCDGLGTPTPVGGLPWLFAFPLSDLSPQCWRKRR